MRRAVLARIGLLTIALLAAPVACAQDLRTPQGALAAAREALRTGKYDEALAAADRVTSLDPASAEGVRVSARALVATGRYGEAEQTLQAFTRAHPSDPSLWNELGSVQQRLGRLADARTSFQHAVDGRAPDSLTANLNLAILQYNGGDIDGAMRAFDRYIDIYNNRRDRLTASELAAVAEACRYLGRNNPQLFHDAQRAFEESIAADSSALEPRIRLAELFLEKYASGEATATINEVLKINPRHAHALLVAAKIRDFDDQSDAGDYLQRSLAVDSVSPDAHAFAALQLIDVERYADAAVEARRGLTVDSTAPQPLIALAAALFLEDDSTGFVAALSKVHARLPKSAEAEVTLANVAARNRRYAQAVAFAQAGTLRDPKDARALAFLGINALRVGDIAKGRETLEQSFKLDPYDPWVKNTLDLLDTFKDYSETHTPRFTLMIEKPDAPLLGLYAEALAEQAYDSLAARYAYQPATPVRVEFYRSHDDFSVRTVGLTALGALGVTFGRVVAMDSPAARKVGDFNWGSTLWHELAHVFTLGASGGRVPRWFSEGLSVMEEHRARPSWGEDASPLFFAAYAGGLLPKVSRLNDGFMRPTFPEEVILSYYMASLVCEMIEQEHGMGAIRGMLSGYRQGRSTDQVVHDVLAMTPAELDEHFDTWVHQRFSREFAAVKPLSGRPRSGSGGEERVGGDFTDALVAAAKLMQGGQVDAAVAMLERAKGLFPEYAQDDSPYALLAKIDLQRGDTVAADSELTALTAINESAWAPNLQLAADLEARGDLRGAAAALSRAVWVNPFDVKLHEKLATLAKATGQKQLAIRERRALVALDPVDKVEAYYELALAYFDAGDVVSARREVLHALELAPNFEKGQDLLLKLRSPGGAG